jgi:ubiquinone/menaquinone biosynthesis C-methylase UbiE
MHRAFDYSNPDALSWKIIRGGAFYVRIPDGGTCLDVGCGSGALTIAAAKENPKATVTGCDRWGKEYASFSRTLCEQNARAENVSNVTFVPGDATALPFAEETFDAVTSNYVYHNIPAKDRQALLLETLRVLKNGGTFAIHDLMSKGRYGDMDAFLEKLRKMGYRNVALIPAGDGKFMTAKECRMYFLSGTALLVGEKHRGESR